MKTREFNVETLVTLDTEMVLAELSDTEIATEYLDRELGSITGLPNIKDALQRGDEKGAMALLKTLICDQYGIIL